MGEGYREDGEGRKTCLNHRPRMPLKNITLSYLHIVCVCVTSHTGKFSCVTPSGCVCACVSVGRGNDRK